MKLLLFTTCLLNSILLQASDKTAGTIAELNALATGAKAGDHIFLKDGVYNDAVIKFSNTDGSVAAPVTIAAQHPGKVFLEGNSSISFSGKYIQLNGFVFRNGGHGLKNKQVIEFRTSDKEQAFHCRISDCEINDFNNTVKTEVNTWVGIYGEYNTVERCLFKSKDNMGPTLVVWLENGKPAHHIITENYFLDRQNGAKVDNGLESIRIGDSKTSFTDAHCVIAFNRFEDCDGEIEIISNKSCHNSYYHNTFFNCDGGLTLRHGNHTLCDGNYFDGGNKTLSYGIRFIGEGQVAINNYFYNLHGSPQETYRSPVSLLNGLVNTPLNGYYPVKNAVVTGNIFKNCKAPLIRIGAFSPKREGMSIAPDSVLISDNLFIDQMHQSVEPLEIITPATNFILRNNKISAGYMVKEKQAFRILGKEEEKTAAKDKKSSPAGNNKAGADWIAPGIVEKMKGVKYTYLSGKQVGPTWMR
jgi:poly(beta-D-mannuronate) lyase